LCATAEQNLGQPVADLNLAFFLHLPAGSDVDAVCRSFNALGIVEMAEPHQMGMALPVAPDFTLEQSYGRSNLDHGTNAFAARAVPAGDASNVTICDIEYGFNAAHEDLPFVQVVRGPIWNLPSDPSNHHGTAVLGELVAENDDQGTVGLAISARPMFASQAPNGNNNPAAAISTALANMEAGDVILSFNGKDITKSTDLPRIVGDTKPGTSATVKVWRKGTTRDLTVVVADAEPDKAVAKKVETPSPQAGTANKSLGISVSDVSDAKKKDLGSRGGVEITNVGEGAAGRAGLRVGDVIVRA
jgi:membrane-associated protease RseP (regulator of RpoE activity)